MLLLVPVTARRPEPTVVSRRRLLHIEVELKSAGMRAAVRVPRVTLWLLLVVPTAHAVAARTVRLLLLTPSTIAVRTRSNRRLVALIIFVEAP